MPNVCVPPGTFFHVPCQLQPLVVREKMGKAESPFNYCFPEPSEVPDPSYSLPTSIEHRTLSHYVMPPPAEWEFFFWNLKEKKRIVIFHIFSYH